MLTLVSETIDTPLGELEIVTDQQGQLRALEWADFHHRLLQLLVRHYGIAVSQKEVGSNITSSGAKTSFSLNQDSFDAAVRQRIQDYFSGDLHVFVFKAAATAET